MKELKDGTNTYRNQVQISPVNVYIADAGVQNHPVFKQDNSKRLLMDENYYTIMSRLDNLTKEVEALKKENALLRHSPIAFLAELTKTVTGHNHQIHFDQVKLNIGNAYYLSHGNFIAPVNGLYQFSITACSTSGHYVVLELTVNTAVVGKVLAGDTGYDECTSKSFLIQLSSGDDVFVQHESQGDYLLSNAVYGFPSFAGVLLRAY
ncbi:heavy metal-binding protein HIP-like [Mytilus trossulus]|uniref:heavy metal-binding protein HIP-like n=1 Tax=Mytilus trossulus TaxID=6551 RepID=UPI003005F128